MPVDKLWIKYLGYSQGNMVITEYGCLSNKLIHTFPKLTNTTTIFYFIFY